MLKFFAEGLGIVAFKNLYPVCHLIFNSHIFTSYIPKISISKQRLNKLIKQNASIIMHSWSIHIIH